MQENSWEESAAGKRIGANLRKFRKNRNLSMEQLSKKIGISRLTLTHIEHGEANPTLSMIWKIANGLNVPVTALLSIESDVSIARKEDGIRLISPDEILVAEPLFQSHGLYELYRGYLKPLGIYRSEAHQHGVTEYVTVMSGRLIIEVNDKTYHLDEYDSIKFKGDRDHIYSNPDSSMAILHFVISYHTS